MKKSLLVLLTIFPFMNALAQESDYPRDPLTGKISYSGGDSINVTKERLFKRAEQFIISQNFDRSESVRCKDKKSVELQFINAPITYTDTTDGVYIGNGFFNYKYRGKDWFVITFNYRIFAKEKFYSYKIYNFRVLEFIKAPIIYEKGKSKSASVSAKTSIAGVGIGASRGSTTSTGFVEFSTGDVRKFDLEDFIRKSAIERATTEFVTDINNFGKQLGATLEGEF